MQFHTIIKSKGETLHESFSDTLTEAHSFAIDTGNNDDEVEIWESHMCADMQAWDVELMYNYTLGKGDSQWT